jgi:hypothetical protein
MSKEIHNYCLTSAFLKLIYKEIIFLFIFNLLYFFFLKVKKKVVFNIAGYILIFSSYKICNYKYLFNTFYFF